MGAPCRRSTRSPGDRVGCGRQGCTDTGRPTCPQGKDLLMIKPQRCSPVRPMRQLSTNVPDASWSDAVTMMRVLVRVGQHALRFRAACDNVPSFSRQQCAVKGLPFAAKARPCLSKLVFGGTQHFLALKTCPCWVYVVECPSMQRSLRRSTGGAFAPLAEGVCYPPID